jgi:outer membrane immunogenic protein
VNYQIGQVVLGAEADFDGATTNQSVAFGPLSGTEQNRWVGTLRARAGIAFGRILAYATAGVAGGGFDYNFNLPAGSASTDITSGAWTAGGGLEVALADALSARAEYLYLDTGNINAAFVGATMLTSRVQENIMRAGLDYRLPVAW